MLNIVSGFWQPSRFEMPGLVMLSQAFRLAVTLTAAGISVPGARSAGASHTGQGCH